MPVDSRAVRGALQHHVVAQRLGKFEPALDDDGGDSGGEHEEEEQQGRRGQGRPLLTAASAAGRGHDGVVGVEGGHIVVVV